MIRSILVGVPLTFERFEAPFCLEIPSSRAVWVETHGCADALDLRLVFYHSRVTLASHISAEAGM